MDFSIIIAYLLTFGIPTLIISFGAMIDDFKSTILIAYTILVSFLAYYTHNGTLPEWILVVVFVIVAVLFVILYKNILTGEE